MSCSCCDKKRSSHDDCQTGNGFVNFIFIVLILYILLAIIMGGVI